VVFCVIGLQEFSVIDHKEKEETQMAVTTFYDHAMDIGRQEKISAAKAMNLLKEMDITRYEVLSPGLKDGLDDVLRNFKESRTGISSLCAFFDFTGEEDADGQIGRMLSWADTLGAQRMLIIPGFYAQHDTQAKRQEKDKRLLNGVQRLVKRAAAEGIRLLMEEFDNFLSPISTIAALKTVLDVVPEIDCAFDTGNFAYNDESELEAYDAFRDRITFVHLKDRALQRPSKGGEVLKTVGGRKLYPSPVGGGCIAIDKIITRLQADGYQGDYAIEHFGTPCQLSFHRQSVQWIREHVPQS